MAFIDIKDPEKREEIVQDYIKNLKEIRERNENEKMRGITQRQDLAKVFQPVVQATEKSASQITSELKNLKTEVKKPKEENEGPKATNKALEYYFEHFPKSKLDKYFGVYKENGIYMMGNKEITVDNQNNIWLDNGTDSYKGTFGLWKLIMLKAPDGYFDEDLDNYKRLIERTNALDMPNARPNERPRTTTKWKFFKKIGLVPGTEDDDEIENESDNEKEEQGSGITFLPGDINGLIEQLHLLLAEHRAGNKSSTKNQIVAILDQLLRLNYLNQEEYNAACRTISC